MWRLISVGNATLRPAPLDHCLRWQVQPLISIHLRPTTYLLRPFNSQGTGNKRKFQPSWWTGKKKKRKKKREKKAPMQNKTKPAQKSNERKTERKDRKSRMDRQDRNKKKERKEKRKEKRRKEKEGKKKKERKTLANCLIELLRLSGGVAQRRLRRPVAQLFQVKQSITMGVNDGGIACRSAPSVVSAPISRFMAVWCAQIRWGGPVWISSTAPVNLEGGRQREYRPRSHLPADSRTASMK